MHKDIPVPISMDWTVEKARLRQTMLATDSFLNIYINTFQRFFTDSLVKL